MTHPVKRPAFQFYPGDWMSDKALRACSTFARGVWMDMLCLMHDSDPYGHLVIAGEPMDMETLARLIGDSPAKARKAVDELVKKGVARRADTGALYSKRMVHDEDLRAIRAASGKLGGNPALTGKPPKPQGPNDGGDKAPVEVLVNQDDKQTPTPSSSSSSASPLVGLSSVRAGESAADADRPTEPPSRAIAGVVVGDIAGAAVQFTAAVNRGIQATHGEQPLILQHGAQHGPTEKILGAGVDPAWAKDWLFHRAKNNTRAHDLPGSLGYFANWCIKAWRKHVAELAAKDAAAAFVPGADPEPAPAPGMSVTPFVPFERFPSAAERLSQRSRANSRIALDAIRAEREQRAGRSA